jgi:hypothetical protein
VLCYRAAHVAIVDVSEFGPAGTQGVLHPAEGFAVLVASPPLTVPHEPPEPGDETEVLAVTIDQAFCVPVVGEVVLLAADGVASDRARDALDLGYGEAGGCNAGG